MLCAMRVFSLRSWPYCVYSWLYCPESWPSWSCRWRFSSTSCGGGAEGGGGEDGAGLAALA